MCCAEIPWKALVKSATVPTDPKAQAVMETQIRQAYTVPAIYEPLGWGPTGAKICATFAKETLTKDDLDFLNDQGRSLFTPYTPPAPATS
jgi:hypothetical protein